MLQWCKMADPTSPYLVVKSVPKGQGINILTCTCVWEGGAIILHFLPGLDTFEGSSGSYGHFQDADDESSRNRPRTQEALEPPCGWKRDST